MTVGEKVRKTVLDGLPQIVDARVRWLRVEESIDFMSNTELLDHISDAIAALMEEGKV